MPLTRATRLLHISLFPPDCLWGHADKRPRWRWSACSGRRPMLWTPGKRGKGRRRRWTWRCGAWVGCACLCVCVCVSRSNVKCGNKWVNKNNTARRLCFPPQRAQNRTSPGGQRVQISAAKTDNFDLTARALVINTGGQKLAVPGPVLHGQGRQSGGRGRYLFAFQAEFEKRTPQPPHTKTPPAKAPNLHNHPRALAYNAQAAPRPRPTHQNPARTGTWHNPCHAKLITSYRGSPPLLPACFALEYPCCLHIPPYWGAPLLHPTCTIITETEYFAPEQHFPAARHVSHWNIPAACIHCYWNIHPY